MVQYCCVLLCKNNAKNTKVSFHIFPKNANIAKQWHIAIERKCAKTSVKMRICSAHFKITDFDNTGKLRKLKIGVIPSLFSFKKSDSKPRRPITYKNKTLDLPISRFC